MAKVLCILCQRGVQLILAYGWARPAILVAGKGRGGMFLFLHFYSCLSWGCSGGRKVSCILCHRGVQLILAYGWARPAILVAGKGRGGMFLFLYFYSCSSWGWSGGWKVSCILCHRGVQLILAYGWARPAILVAGKGRGGMILFLLFLHVHSCSSFFPGPLFHLFYYLFSLFSLFLWMTQTDPQGLTCC